MAVIKSWECSHPGNLKSECALEASFSPRMIKRLWHRWTTRENAQPYQHLLRTEILPAIGARNIAGYHGSELLRCESGDEVEFPPHY
jgi:hypothetical protein